MEIPSWLASAVVAVVGGVITVLIAVWRAGAITERVMLRVDSLTTRMDTKADDTETALRIAGVAERTTHMATIDRVAALEHRIDRLERRDDDRTTGAKR